MSVKTTVQTYKTSQTITRTFKILGNEPGATVRKYRSHLGDGDIYTGHGGKVLCSVLANLTMPNSYTVRLKLRYDVWESSYNPNATKGGADRLYFEVVKDINLRNFIDEGRRSLNDGRTTITTASTIALAATAPEAYYQAWYNTKDSRTGWMSIDPNDYPSINRAQTWIPLKDIRVKIDGSGSELNKVGNIGISGKITFRVTRTDVVTKKVVDDDAVTRNAAALRYGSSPAAITLTSNIQSVLGRGYDICDRYANSGSCRGVVLDLNKLNTYRRIIPDTVESADSYTYEGEGIEEYTRSIEKKLNISVSANAFGASFSNETKTSFKEDTYTKEGYKMITQRDYFKHAAYTVDGFSSPTQLIPFLTSKFLTDLDTMTATEFVKAYGTHIVLGMVEGARFDYNMSYRENITKKSTAKSFETTTSVSYSSTGAVNKPKEEQKKSNSEKVYDDLVAGKLDSKKLDSFTKYVTATKNNAVPTTNSASGSKPAANPAGWGFSASVGYTETETTTNNKETKSTEVKCAGIGGDPVLLARVTRDLSLFDSWWNNLRKYNYAFIDFIENTLVPIYEFVPAGHRLSAAMVKQASDAYQAERGRATVEYRDVVLTNYHNSKGSANTTVVQDDDEISTKSGKDTGWTLNAELINFLDGTVGCAVAVNIHEGGINAGRSVLQTHMTIPVPLGNYRAMAIDTTRLATTRYQTEGKITGEIHDWFEITEQVANCPFFNTYTGQVFLKVDGSGGDKGNIGIQLSLRVPVICYKNF